MAQPEVEVYYTPYCGYCHAARRLLDQKGVAHRAIDVSGDSEARMRIAELSGQSTVPQIFIGGASIGGYAELAAMEQRGELDERLAADV